MNAQTSYDRTPYEGLPANDSHPERLYTIGFLFGLSPQPVTASRVLELGCADGGNLIPMAYNLPGSEFLGVDLSARQIEMGRETINGLGLTNIRLEQADILDINASHGVFDYIICHGVYSWVPTPVRDKIMAIMAANLCDHGVGYVDFNTYPGWYGPETLRRLMKLHTDGIDDPRDKVAQSLSIIDLYSRFLQTENMDYISYMQKEVARVKKVGARYKGGTYIYHEYLEDVNQPEYFHQFAQRADEHGLRYLGESIYANMMTHGFPKEAEEILSGVGHDIVLLEQYMDFLRNRRFRNSLLCRRERDIHREIRSEDLMALMAVCTDKVTNEIVEQVPGGSLSKAALKILLEQRPRALYLPDLLEKAEALIGETPANNNLDPTTQRERLVRDFIHYYSLNVIQMRAWQANFTLTPGRCPRVSALALHQASQGRRWISTQCHEPSMLPLLLMDLLVLLDGSRDRDALLDWVKSAVDLEVKNQNGPVDAADPTPDLPAKILENMLSRIAANAVLLE